MNIAWKKAGRLYCRAAYGTSLVLYDLTETLFDLNLGEARGGIITVVANIQRTRWRPFA
jgi:hypothetical protein